MKKIVGGTVVWEVANSPYCRGRRIVQRTVSWMAKWVNILYAEMMKLVDMTDLNSVGHCGRVGSSPILGTTIAVC